MLQHVAHTVSAVHADESNCCATVLEIKRSAGSWVVSCRHTGDQSGHKGEMVIVLPT